MADRPQVIVFAGSVGAGKTTQMKLLTSELKKREFKIKKTFLKKGHFFAFIMEYMLAKIFVRRLNGIPPMRVLLDNSSHLFKKCFNLWLIVDVYSNCIKFLFNIYLPIRTGYTLLVEEYIPATIASYIYYCDILGIPQSKIKYASSLMLKMMSKFETQAIFFDADSSILKRRWHLRGSQEESMRYIEMQRTILLPVLKSILSKRLLYIRTDNLSIEEVHGQLISKYFSSKS